MLLRFLRGRDNNSGLVELGSLLGCLVSCGGVEGIPISDHKDGAAADASVRAPDASFLDGGQRGVDAGVGGAGFCVDAAPAPDCADADIEADNYDQTCQSDGDCILIGEGQSCFPCSLAYGPFGAVNRAALPSVMADIAKTPGATSGSVSCAPACETSHPACCRSGQCIVGDACLGGP